MCSCAVRAGWGLSGVTEAASGSAFRLSPGALPDRRQMICTDQQAIGRMAAGLAPRVLRRDMRVNRLRRVAGDNEVVNLNAKISNV